MDPNADPDKDGMNNLQECIAGTDPLDRTSVLDLGVTVDPARQTVRLSWTSVSNRVYDLFWSTNFVEGFQILSGGILATPPSNVEERALGPHPDAFYRVQVESGE